MSQENETVTIQFTGPIGEARYKGYVFPMHTPVTVPAWVAEKLLYANSAFKRVSTPSKPSRP